MPPTKTKEMAPKLPAVFKWVLVLMCMAQVIVTGFFAIQIISSSYSSVAPKLAWPKPPFEEHPVDMRYAEERVPDMEFNFEAKEKSKKVEATDETSPKKKVPHVPVIELWSKAAIGRYLWQHILEGKEEVDLINPGSYIGELVLPKFVIKYRSGPGVLRETVPHDAHRVVLVANGRTSEGIQETKKWLEYLQTWVIPPRLVLMMLGNENCENGWVEPYLYPRGPIESILLTYDDPRVDNFKFHQWPLGVATYRNFPVLDEDQVKTDVSRKYACNFQATVYKGSSRVLLHKILIENKFASEHCFIKGREKWSPTESPESMNDYIWTLIQSELTLCPVGMNAESYRVYEALSCGSTPVIEDVRPGGRCDATVWRLLKKMNPPVVWIKSWNQLPDILAREFKYSEQYLIKRRQRVFQWYEWFKMKMRDKFISVITSSLLNPD